MTSTTGRLALILGLSLVSAPLFAHADDEVIVVEALNTRLISYEKVIGFQTVYQADMQQVPETLCGSPGGDPTHLVPCYEMAMTYVTYPGVGDQILHLPECNAVNPLDADCELPANNLCAGNLHLDRFQIKAPVCGEIRVDIVALTGPSAATLAPQATGTWAFTPGCVANGTCISKNREVYLNRAVNGVTKGEPFRLAKIRVPAGTVRGVVALVTGRHTAVGSNQFDFGFFNVFNRLWVYNETMGNVFNLAANPMLFQ